METKTLGAAETGEHESGLGQRKEKIDSTRRTINRSETLDHTLELAPTRLTSKEHVVMRNQVHNLDINALAVRTWWARQPLVTPKPRLGFGSAKETKRDKGRGTRNDN